MGKPTDQELDVSVAGMLRFGVTLSALVVLAGGLLFLRHPWSAIPDYSHFRAGDSSLRTLSGIVRGAVRLSPQSIIQLGLILLIATPVARIAFCVVGFARQRSRLYVLISLTVLIILLFSLVNSVL
jgi:uncharacterized membrane protein